MPKGMSDDMKVFSGIGTVMAVNNENHHLMSFKNNRVSSTGGIRVGM